jgi:hypothetical protein
MIAIPFSINPANAAIRCLFLIKPIKLSINPNKAIGRLNQWYQLYGINSLRKGNRKEDKTPIIATRPIVNPEIPISIIP